MKLWLLRPTEALYNEISPWEPWYDKVFGFVVRAETEERAREIANLNGGNEVGEPCNKPYRTGGDPWLNVALSSCIELKSDGDECMIIRDYASA